MSLDTVPVIEDAPAPAVVAPDGPPPTATGLLRDTAGRTVAGIGDSTRAFGALCAMVLDAAWLTVDAVVHRRVPWREVVEQAWFLTSVSLLPAILIALPFGTVLVIEVGGLANQIGATSYVGAVDASVVVGQVAPIVTALILSGAGGSAICSDLGARTIRDEIAALQVMGIDPVQRLVAPRLVAMIGVSLLLNGVVAMAGILSGYIAAVTVLHGTAGGFLASFSTFAQSADVVESMLKAGLFGFLAATVSSYKGLTTRSGAAAVGEAVNQSVVATGVTLFLANLAITEVFLVLVPARIP
jgi:phospholipid/cholesterol/gamma-HCH transport system permease protein